MDSQVVLMDDETAPFTGIDQTVNSYSESIKRKSKNEIRTMCYSIWIVIMLVTGAQLGFQYRSVYPRSYDVIVLEVLKILSLSCIFFLLSNLNNLFASITEKKSSFIYVWILLAFSYFLPGAFSAYVFYPMGPPLLVISIFYFCFYGAFLVKIGLGLPKIQP